MLGVPRDGLAVQKAVCILDRFHVSLLIPWVLSLVAQTGIGHHNP